MHRITAFAILATLAATTQAQNRVRVGTFHTPSLVVAYYRSDAWAQVLKAKMAERDQAKQAGATAKVAELEKWGASHQELAHQQLTGEAPVTNILAELKPAMAEIAESQHLDAIVQQPLYTAPNVDVVDITDALVAHFHPDEKTKSMIQDLRRKATP